MKNEVWKDIRGWSLYQVSNMGRVRSKDRINLRSNGRVDNRKGKVLSPSKSKADGYLRVSFWDKEGSRRQTHSVHVLVANAFCGTPVECVHHKNAVRTDNRAENLEHVTMRQNTIEKWKRVKRSPTGASLCKGKTIRPWRSATKYKGRVYCLGYFDTEREAAAAYHGVHKFIQAIEYERNKP